ncbi:hypothetical protein, partial [Saccharothrix violaceirubra]
MSRVESRTLREIGRCLATGRPHHALDHAFTLLSAEPHTPGRRFLLLTELAARAGRPVGAAYYGDLARRAFPDAPTPIEIPAFSYPVKEVQVSAMPPERAHYAVGRAEQALRWLDHRVTASPFTHDWARTTLLRETRASAHLDGVHLALIEVFQHVLPTSPGSLWREPAFSPYLAATLSLLDTPTPTPAAEPLLDVLTGYVRSPPADGHALRLALPVALVRARLLTRPWLPLSTHHPGTPDLSRSPREDVLAEVGRIADAVTTDQQTRSSVINKATRLIITPRRPTSLQTATITTDHFGCFAVRAFDLLGCDGIGGDVVTAVGRRSVLGAVWGWDHVVGVRVFNHMMA